ncbi:MAG: hypothetical protein WCD86_26910, partial [Ktedonobacteraceae bacterium]
MITSYASPVDKLLALGKPDAYSNVWQDYTALEIGPEQIPDLIRLALDNELRYDHLGDDENEDELDEKQELAFWGPLHAIHALGQLHAEAAIEPLLTLFDIADKGDDEWVLEDFPTTYAMIGPAALPVLAAFVSDSSHLLYARSYAGEAIVSIGNAYPEKRAESIDALSRALEQYEENDYELNGLLISNLLHLKAVEAAPLIEKAFEADRVEEFIVGDWDDVQVALGLKEPSEKQQSRNFLSPLVKSPQSTRLRPEDVHIVKQQNPSMPPSGTKKSSYQTKKAHKKMEKRSRKQN